jgi:hypothetical protein
LITSLLFICSFSICSKSISNFSAKVNAVSIFFITIALDVPASFNSILVSSKDLTTSAVETEGGTTGLVFCKLEHPIKII